MNVGDDGKLHVDEVYSLPMDNIELVVLSACQTSVGNLQLEGDDISNITAGDELVSLNRAFLFQSPTVISTLWTVDDAATGLLMEQFYTHLLDGRSKADALRLAQLYVRDYGDDEYSNPYYWAGFVLSGDGGEVEVLASVTAPIEMETAIPKIETTVTDEDTETAVPEPIQPSNSSSNGICAGAALLLAVVALVVGNRKKSRKEDK